MPLSEGLRGFVPVLVTPFDERGRLISEWFAAIVDWQIEAGAEGLCVAAGNGEAGELTDLEVGELVRIAVERSRGRLPIIAGAMGQRASSVEAVIARARVAVAAGASAVLVTPDPASPRASREDILARYAATYTGAKAPIVAYNSPRHYGVTLDSNLLSALVSSVDLVGLKEASRDCFHIGEVIATHAARFPIFIGPGWFIMPGIALGAAGFLSTGPDLLGPDSARIVALAREKPDAAGRALHTRIARLYHLLLDAGLAPSPAPLKAALNLMGKPAGVPRDPAKRLTPDAHETLRRGLIELEVIGAAAGRDAA